jgi:hypothetical protein
MNDECDDDNCSHKGGTESVKPAYLHGMSFPALLWNPAHLLSASLWRNDYRMRWRPGKNGEPPRSLGFQRVSRCWIRSFRLSLATDFAQLLPQTLLRVVESRPSVSYRIVKLPLSKTFLGAHVPLGCEHFTVCMLNLTLAVLERPWLSTAVAWSRVTV